MTVWSWLVVPPNKRGYGRWATVIPNGHSSVKKMLVRKKRHITQVWPSEFPLIIPFLPVNTDSQIPVPPTTVSTKSFYKLGNESYKLVAQKMNWDEARRQCQADDADLASILNPYSQAHITLQISKYNEPVWIGLNSNVVKAQPVTVWLNVFSSVKNAQ